jgi:hypothetical protein
MALKGTLKDFGIADILQLIGQQQKTGVLHLSERDDLVQVVFKDGNVVRAESSTRKKKELLGTMLARAGLVTERQLEEALLEQKRTLRRLGDILVASGSIEPENLREMTQLQTNETLYRLFSWKNGNYEFQATEVEVGPDAIPPVRSESVLMEGFRRVDEWPLIRRRISSTATTFERLKDLPLPKSDERNELDSALDEAFDGLPSPQAGADEPEEALGSNERKVWALTEPGVNAQAIADRSRLGDFEACKALFNLINLGYLKAVQPSGKTAGAQVGAERGWADRLATVLGRVALGTLSLAAVLVVANRLHAGPALGSPGERAFADPALKRLLGRAQLSRLEAAVATFQIEKGRSPGSLEELVAAGILSEADLRYPWKEAYYFRTAGTSASHVLLPPLR